MQKSDLHQNMTKHELAQKISEQCELEGIAHISLCSCYAVAQEVLGNLKAQHDIEYAASRGGVGYEHFAHLFPTELSSKKFGDLREVFYYLEQAK